MRQRLFFTLITLVGLCAAPFFAQAQSPDTTGLQAIVAKYYKEGVTAPNPGGKPGQAPGLAVGVVYNGQVIFEGYIGLANLQHQVPVGPQSRFNIASVAKQFTATMALQQVQQGKLDLEAPLTQYMPEFYANLEQAPQLKHIFTHRSGIRDYCDLQGMQGDPWWRRVGQDNDDVLELVAQQTDLNFAPGSSYTYSNTNYTLLTALIAQASNQSFTDYASNFFDALGMPNTRFNKNYMEVLPNMARPYANWGNGQWQEYPMLTDLHGDGFLFTTLPDQLRWEALLQNPEQGPFPALLKASQDSVAGIHQGFYHYGLEKRRWNGHFIREHSGGTGAFSAHVIRFNHTPISVVAMSSNSSIVSMYVAQEVAQMLVPPLPQNTAPNPNVPATAYKEKRIAPQALAGQYLSPKGSVIKILAKGDTLMYKVGQNRAWDFEHLSGNMYSYNTESPIRIYFEKGSKKQFTIYFEEGTNVYTKLEAWQPETAYLEGLSGSYYNKETDTRFTLSTTNEGNLRLVKGRIDENVELLYEDNMKVGNYKFKAVRDDNQQVLALMVNYARLQNVRFVKEN